MSALQTDLSKYDNSWYHPGRNLMIRIFWYLINHTLFKSAFPFYGPKRFMLRLFGAKVGDGLIIKPHVNIKYPWKLEIGNNVWIGELVWIDNLAKVTLKDNCCVSQGAMLLCGNHDYRKSTFNLIVADITLEDGAWAGARTVICPGVRLGSHSLLTVGSVATGNLEDRWIYQGNPARKLRPREFKS
jgi:putative colanic acid biosynthesis acetyltransferase WcaF